MQIILCHLVVEVMFVQRHTQIIPINLGLCLVDYVCDVLVIESAREQHLTIVNQ